MEEKIKKYLMPEMTEKKKKEIIEDLEDKLSEETFSLYGYAVRISLAVLTTDLNSQLKPIKLPEPNDSLSKNEKVTYRLIMKEVKNELLKQGYNVQK